MAAIDCGTNSTRLLVADRTGTALDRRMRITRLGEGVDVARRLTPGAIERTLAVLGEYREVMDAHGVERARLVATSAARDAANGHEFLEAAASVTGALADVLTGDEEGRLAFAGATAGLEPGPGADVVVDIGGGSTELVLGLEGTLGAISLDIGCVRLAERYLTSDPPTPEQLTETTAAVVAQLDRATRALPGLATLPPGSRLIGLAGTVATLAALEQGLVTYDRDKVHHFELSEAAVDRWASDLAAESAEARLQRPGMDPGRQDVHRGWRRHPSGGDGPVRVLDVPDLGVGHPRRHRREPAGVIRTTAICCSARPTAMESSAAVLEEWRPDDQGTKE